MQLQHISKVYPNVISISRIRQDIDVLTSLLRKYPEIKVLKGQNVIFKIIRPTVEVESHRSPRINLTVFDDLSEKYHQKPSASRWIIEEREKMRSKKYYAGHRR